MSVFKEVTKYIYRLEVPYFTVYTSVFLIDTLDGYVLVDCATTDEDVDGYIIPALKKFGAALSEVKKIVITHDHSDHAGGLSQIIKRIPHIEVIKEDKKIFENLYVYPLPGHTKDFIGVLDVRVGTLISGDGLQGAGIKQYRTMLEDKQGYIKTLEKIKADERIDKILFSHAYEPWYKDYMSGRKEILDCLDVCKLYIGEL